MHWYEADVMTVERRLSGDGAVPEQAVVFYGSSSIRLWQSLATDFPGHPVVNAGFGGSTLVACAWFYERLVLPLEPARLVLYAGDNDLGDGCDLDSFAKRLNDLLDTIDHFHPGMPLALLAMKSSPARAHLETRITAANDLCCGRLLRRHKSGAPSAFIDTRTPLLDAGAPDAACFADATCFADDGLHLSPEGYRRWAAALTAASAEVFGP